MVYENWKHINLVEWNDLFRDSKDENGKVILNKNQQPVIETSGLLFNVLKKEFLTANNISEIESRLKEVIELKESLIKLEEGRKKYITAEIDSLKKEIETIRKSFNLEIKEKKEELNKEFEIAKKALNKQFLLELGKPLSNNNKAVLSVLKEFYKHIRNGLDSVNEICAYETAFKQNIPKLKLARNTIYNLLDVCTFHGTGGNWNSEVEGYNKEWSNKTLELSLNKLINIFETDIDTNNVLLNIVGKTPTIQIIDKKENKAIRQIEVIDNQQDENAEQEKNENEEFV